MIFYQLARVSDIIAADVERIVRQIVRISHLSVRDPMTRPTIAETLQRHAMDCERMAKASTSAASWREWKPRAERARSCTALYEAARPTSSKGRMATSHSVSGRP